MARSSTFLSQISDGRCSLGDVSKDFFEATLKSSAFLFEDLTINATDILSNQFFFDLFSNEETVHHWLSAGVLQPVLFEHNSFEDVAESMVERGTILGLKIPEAEKPKALVEYAKRLDRKKPSFVTARRPFRPAYAEHLKNVVASTQRNPPTTVSREALRKTADWLDRQADAEVFQSSLWKFWEKSLDRRSQRYLRRVSDTCYYLAQGEVLGVSHFSTDCKVARIVEALYGPSREPTGIARGKRVQEATSKFQGSHLLKLSFPAVAILRQHEAFSHLRKELRKLTNGKTRLPAVVGKMNDCAEPLRQLADRAHGRGSSRDSGGTQEWRESGEPGVPDHVCDYRGRYHYGSRSVACDPSGFGLLQPSVIALVGAAISLASLLPKARAAGVVSANYDLARRTQSYWRAGRTYDAAQGHRDYQVSTRRWGQHLGRDFLPTSRSAQRVLRKG